MSQFRFDEFTKAYRAAHADELDAPAVLRRIQGTLCEKDQRRSRNRWVTWVGSMGLTTLLGASLAYATPFGRSWVDWMTEVATSSVPTQFEHQFKTGDAPETLPSSMKTEPLSESPSSPMVEARAMTDDLLVALEPSIASQHAVPPPPRRPTIAKATEPVRSPPVAGERPSDVRSLYSEAQRLQFVERDFVAAALVWEHYLETTDDAVLRPGAEYNRIVCLVHSRRYHEARVELKRLTGPLASPAYRSRAATLLHSLEKTQR